MTDGGLWLLNHSVESLAGEGVSWAEGTAGTKPGVAASYCCVTNCSKMSGLRQQL